MNTKRDWNATFAFVLFALAATVVLRWLWSDVFLAECHSDTVDTLFAAAASRDAGAIASPTFHYPYFIPFGGSMLVLPFLPLFGTGIATLRCGMTVFLLLFVLAAVALFRSLKWNRATCWLAVALVLTVASATPKMREICFGHVLFYSLGTLFFFWGLAIAPDPAEEEATTRRERMLRKALFFFCMAWAASCGKPLLLYAVVPVIGAWILVRCADPRPFSKSRDGSALLPSVLGAGVGLTVFLLLSRNLLPIEYAGPYELFSPPSQWWDNLGKLPERWISLLCPIDKEPVPIASGAGLPVAGQIALALLLAFAPILGLVRIWTFSRKEKMLLAGHWILVAEVLFYWVFGSVSDANWRLCPVALSSVASTACVVKNLLCSETVFGRRAAATMAVFIAAVCILGNLRTSLLPGNGVIWRDRDSLIPLLETIGVQDGYCTDFWFCNVTTAISGNRFRLRDVWTDDEGGWKPSSYLVDDRWYEPDPSRTRTVFVCYPNEEERAPAEGRTGRFECWQIDVRNKRYAKLVVLVYDGDCMNPGQIVSKQQP